mmetsp:Transcript_18829/g.35108  ORF Transcript_18829/g.35108 Transcript_18829/m.35108 type:complete len:140 (+) Transcript_18829:287-706(+)
MHALCCLINTGAAATDVGDLARFFTLLEIGFVGALCESSAALSFSAVCMVMLKYSLKYLITSALKQKYTMQTPARVWESLLFISSAPARGERIPAKFSVKSNQPRTPPICFECITFEQATDSRVFAVTNAIARTTTRDA